MLLRVLGPCPVCAGLLASADWPRARSQDRAAASVGYMIIAVAVQTNPGYVREMRLVRPQTLEGLSPFSPDRGNARPHAPHSPQALSSLDNKRTSLSIPIKVPSRGRSRGTCHQKQQRYVPRLTATDAHAQVDHGRLPSKLHIRGINLPMRFPADPA